MSVLAFAPAGATSVEQIEALLPWRLNDEEVEARYARLRWLAMDRSSATSMVEEPG